MTDLSTVQILALATLINPPERQVYGLPVADIPADRAFIYRSLVAQGVARVAHVGYGNPDAYMLTYEGAKALQAALKR